MSQCRIIVYVYCITDSWFRISVQISLLLWSSVETKKKITKSLDIPKYCKIISHSPIQLQHNRINTPTLLFTATIWFESLCHYFLSFIDFITCIFNESSSSHKWRLIEDSSKTRSGISCCCYQIPASAQIKNNNIVELFEPMHVQQLQHVSYLRLGHLSAMQTLLPCILPDERSVIQPTSTDNASNGQLNTWCVGITSTL